MAVQCPIVCKEIYIILYRRGYTGKQFCKKCFEWFYQWGHTGKYNYTTLMGGIQD